MCSPDKYHLPTSLPLRQGYYVAHTCPSLCISLSLRQPHHEVACPVDSLSAFPRPPGSYNSWCLPLQYWRYWPYWTRGGPTPSQVLHRGQGKMQMWSCQWKRVDTIVLTSFPRWAWESGLLYVPFLWGILGSDSVARDLTKRQTRWLASLTRLRQRHDRMPN